MQEQSNSVYKTLTWLLLLVVVGLYALHLWYSGTLKDNLAAQQTKLTADSVRLTEARSNLDLAAKAEKGLREEIDRLQAEHRAAVRGLEEQLSTAAQANLAVKADLDALQQRDAETLAAEQHKAADARAEMQARLDAANQKIAALATDIEGLQQAKADAAARHEEQLTAAAQQHQARLAEAEAQLNDRIAALRTALEGSDPERASLFAGYERRIQATQEAVTALEAGKADLSARLAAATRKVEETNLNVTEAQQALSETQAALTQTRGELVDLETRHDAAMDKAAMDQAALQAKHDAAVEKSAEERAALEERQSAALDQAAKQAAEIQARHTAALDQAAKAQAALQARHEAELAQAKAEHDNQMSEAQSRNAKLAAGLAAEQAALTTLQTRHDQMVADLSGKLGEAEKALAASKSDLAAAAQQKAGLEQRLADAQGAIATLEQDLDVERKHSEAARLAVQQAHTQAMAQQRGLLVRISELGGRETERGMLLSLAESDLKFPISKATLPAGELPSLDRIAGLLSQYPRLTARIEGHTDAAGRDDTNLALSQARADAVKQALVDRGVAAERLEAVGLGETRPIADNATKAGSRQNRRVEVYINEGAN
jgi:chemotaxis protein MotB